MRTFLAVALGLSLMSGTASNAADATIDVDTSVDEKHYDVRGTDPGEVFSSIQARGLGGQAGLSASGLTESDLSYSISTVNQEGACKLQEVAFDMEDLRNQRCRGHCRSRIEVRTNLMVHDYQLNIK